MRGLGHLIAATVGFFAASAAADHHQVGADTGYHHQPHAHSAAGAAAAQPLATQYAAAAPVADPYQQHGYDYGLQVRQDNGDIIGKFFEVFSGPSVALIVFAFVIFTTLFNYVNFLQAKINAGIEKEEELELMLDNLTTRIGMLEDPTTDMIAGFGDVGTISKRK